MKLKKGKLHLIVGPMFSGKTSALIKKINEDKVKNMKTLTVKWALDTRYELYNESFIISHDNQKVDALKCNENLMEYFNIFKEYCSIGIDEGHFFADLHEAVSSLISIGINVYIAALSSNYQMKNFKNIIEIYPIADKIEHKVAICTKCYMEAPFTKKKCFNLYGTNFLEYDVGGEEKYESLCRDCWLSEAKYQLDKDF